MLADTYLYWADGINVSESLLTNQNLDTTLAAMLNAPPSSHLIFLEAEGLNG